MTSFVKNHFCRVLLLIAMCSLVNSYQLNAQGNPMIDSLKNLLIDPPSDSLEARYNNSIMGLYAPINTDSAIFYGERAKAIGERLGDYRLLASNMLNFGTIYWFKSDFSTAMDYYTRSATLYDSLGYESDAATARTNIGTIYLALGEMSKAEPYFKDVAEIHIRNGYEEGLAYTYHYLGYINHYVQQYDSAIYYFEKSLKLSEKLRLIGQQAWATSGLGESYKGLGETRKARDYLVRSLELEQLQGNKSGELRSYLEIASLEKQLGNYQAAEEFLQTASNMEALQDNYIEQKLLYNEYVMLYEEWEKIDKAFEYQKKLMVALDSTRVRENRAQLEDINEKYETERKEARITSLEEQQRIKDLEIQQQRNQNIILVVAAGLLLAIAFFIFLLFVQIRKRKQEVESRNETITKINKALNKSQDELLLSNKTKDKFFALIAHDLRGPVTSMQGIGRMLEFYSKKGDQQRINQLISQVDQSAQSVNHLLDNLLKWALSQTKGLNYQPASFELGQMVEECRIIFEENLKAKQLTLHIDVDHGAVVEGDYNMISTVMRNLLSNAIKFSPVGEQINLSTKQEADHLVISVEDHGGGIPPETLEKLNSNLPLASKEGTRQEKGTGLGLTLCQEFIKKHGAEMQIDSNDIGTKIAFGLKLASVEAPI